ncbi:hypothetical protein [Rhodopirellula sp. P2]|uniref:hypothetical protein n=1 Tax=Rhodopirellula sp. P2 TaxID=2127060 RepID=UPI0023679EDA|nr:hypothetical protein [Rhodopirellula sp. P2]WDQ15696.1 hypothetical protein PSR62_18890 [Rhodopirellula sp. P2]
MTSNKVAGEIEPRPASYQAFVRFMLGFGILTGLAGLLWLVAGVGIHGAPISANAFQVDRHGYTDHWSFWMIVVVIAGPNALFPAALLERFRLGDGAIALLDRMGGAVFARSTGDRPLPSGPSALDHGLSGSDANASATNFQDPNVTTPP